MHDVPDPLHLTVQEVLDMMAALDQFRLSAPGRSCKCIYHSRSHLLKISKPAVQGLQAVVWALFPQDFDCSGKTGHDGRD